MLTPSFKPKTCQNCGKEFNPWSTTQTACSPRCAQRGVKKQKTAKVLAERAQVRQRREALKTIPDLIKEAQVAFNAYIRERDKDQPCICCGKPLGHEGVGGGFDCGHYRSVGSASHLRYDERNAHGQRKVCNRYGSGRAVDYRIGLIGRIGRDAVEALEADNTPKKWERDELIAIRDTYRAKKKELEKKNGA